MIKPVSLDYFRREYQRPALFRYAHEQALVQKIIEAVRVKGDAALFEYTECFDGVRPKSFKISEEEITEAASGIAHHLRMAVQEACHNIEKYHIRQYPSSFWQPGDNKMLGLIYRPFDRAGVYVPGGTAAYPSSVLMTVIPARVAGVEEIIVCSPPDKDGCLNPLTLYAARVAGASAIYRVGGAQAIAALAYGTETIPRVQVIAGPGNIYVTLAKKEVYGDVGIDMLAGPSEVMIVASEGGDARFIASDLLSQAEHDVLSRVFLVTTSAKLARDVNTELQQQLAHLPRRAIAEKSLQEQGWIILADDLAEVWAVVNMVAPEHLEIQLPEPWMYLNHIKNAGSIFLGEHSPESLGDYLAGINHVLPTGGAAHFSSPLGVHNFMKYSQVMAYGAAALADAAPAITSLSRAEGLEAHARAIEVRIKDEKNREIGGG